MSWGLSDFRALKHLAFYFLVSRRTRCTPRQGLPTQGVQEVQRGLQALSPCHQGCSVKSKIKPLRDVPKQRFWLQLRQYQSLARHFLGYRPPFHLHVVYISKCRMPDKKYAPFTRQSKEYMPKVGGVFRTTSSGSSTTRKIKSISLKGQELSVEGCIDAPGSPRLHHTPLIYSLLVFHIPRPVKLD